MARLATALLSLLTLASSTLAQSAPQSCGAGKKCPAATPCCSAYGQCGVGAYCLGGCDPINSNSLTSCAAAPVCKSAKYEFSNLDNIAPNTQYLGNTTGVDWVSEGTPVQYTDSTGPSVMLTMAPDTVGTLLSSTHYVWFGKISAKMRTSAGQGVVTAFIMMSDVKDEIDFEFVGADLQHAQSNFYWQGTLNYTNEKNISSSNTDTDVHTYEIDWTEDSITWSVDGQSLRTLNKADTYNSTTGNFDYPQTPARVELSLWPAGQSQNGNGTVNWAGGLINWNSPYMTNGYYHAQVYEVDVQCYPAPAGADVKGQNSYIYTNAAGTNNTVEVSNDIDILASFLATGDNLGYNPNAPKSSASASPSAGASSTSSVPLPTGSDVNTIPGVVGAGTRGTDSTSNSDNSNPSGSGSGSTSGSGSSNGGSYVGGGDGSFSQGLGGTTKSSDAGALYDERVMKGSALGALLALAAALFL